MGTLRSKLLVSLAALAAILVPCATAAHSTFVSHRYHYSLQVPDGFHVRAATLSIVPGFYPSTPGPAADRFIQGTNTIVVASTALSEPESLSAWVKSRISVIARYYQCTNPKTRATTVSGSAAVELVYPNCYASIFDAVESVHGGRGYDVYWLGAPATGTFHRDLATFRFTG